MEMKEKTAIVTGAAGTLCSEIAIRLAKEGAFVILIGRTEEKLNQVAQKILEEGGQCRVEPGDVTDEKRMEEIAAALKEEGKSCDILINGAGGNQNRAVTQNTAFTKTELEKENQELQAKLDELSERLDEASQAEEDAQAAENEMIKSLRTELDRTKEAYEALLEAKSCDTREGNVTFSRAMQTLERLKDYLGQTALEEYKALGGE